MTAGMVSRPPLQSGKGCAEAVVGTGPRRRCFAQFIVEGVEQRAVRLTILAEMLAQPLISTGDGVIPASELDDVDPYRPMLES